MAGCWVLCWFCVCWLPLKRLPPNRLLPPWACVVWVVPAPPPKRPPPCCGCDPPVCCCDPLRGVSFFLGPGPERSGRLILFKGAEYVKRVAPSLTVGISGPGGGFQFLSSHGASSKQTSRGFVSGFNIFSSRWRAISSKIEGDDGSAHCDCVSGCGVARSP